jgi:hypothetical protein
MADNLQVGARVNVFLAGVPPEWFTKAQITINSNSQEIITVNEGYAGESPSTPMVEISVDFAVPKSGANLALFSDYVANGKAAALQFNAGGAKYASTGRITTVSTSGGANAVTEGSFTWRGKATPLTV